MIVVTVMLIIITIIIGEPLDDEQTLKPKDSLTIAEVPQRCFCSLVFVVFNPLNIVFCSLVFEVKPPLSGLSEKNG